MTTALTITVAAALAAVSDDTHGPRLLEQTRRAPKKDDLKPSIHINVELTLVPVTVTDPFGQVVSGLQKHNFSIYDEKQPRDIAYFSREDAPASVGLVFDMSGSMKSNMPVAQQAVSKFMETLNPEDEACVVTVSSRPELVSGFTSKAAEIQNAILFSRAKGMTALIDGVYLALNRVHTGHNPRKAVVVVSDGQDNNSRYTLRELTSYAMEADAQIYTIAVHENAASAADASLIDEGEGLLKTLSEKTGGVHFTISDPNDLPAIMQTVATDLHNLYVLGYYPPDDALPGKYRRIRVQLNVPKGMPRMQVYARRGYYAPQS